jgi:hypothetical protein
LVKIGAIPGLHQLAPRDRDRIFTEGVLAMRSISLYFASLLAAGAAAVAIAAPSASAASEPTCVDLGASTQCQRPGNVQINTTPPLSSLSPFSIYGPFFSYDRGAR